jgi:hypothetical protein
MHKTEHKKGHLPMQILEHFQQEFRRMEEQQLQLQLQTKYSWRSKQISNVLGIYTLKSKKNKERKSIKW